MAGGNVYLLALLAIVSSFVLSPFTNAPSVKISCLPEISPSKVLPDFAVLALLALPAKLVQVNVSLPLNVNPELKDVALDADW